MKDLEPPDYSRMDELSWNEEGNPKQSKSFLPLVMDNSLLAILSFYYIVILRMTILMNERFYFLWNYYCILFVL